MLNKTVHFCIITLTLLIVSASFTACNKLNNEQDKVIFSSVDITGSAKFIPEIKAQDINRFVFDLQKFIKNENEKAKKEGLNKKLTIVSFGYIACPDYCPATLKKISAIKNNLKKYNEDINVIFVNIDAQYVSPIAIKEYLKAFDENFIGVHPTQAQLNIIKNNFNIYVGERINGIINHTTGMYILDYEGKLRLYAPYNLSLEQIIADLKKIPN